PARPCRRARPRCAGSARRRRWAGAGPLLRLCARDLHRARAALAVLADVGGEFLGRAADHLVALVDELLLPELRLIEDLARIGVDAAHRLARGARGHEEPEPRVGLDLRIAELGER